LVREAAMRWRSEIDKSKVRYELVKGFGPQTSDRKGLVRGRISRRGVDSPMPSRPPRPFTASIANKTNGDVILDISIVTIVNVVV
jgi:hypothetical protein